MKMLETKSVQKAISETLTYPIRNVIKKYQLRSQCCMIIYSPTWDLIRSSLITPTEELVYREKY
jgi:hypothetical protein